MNMFLLFAAIFANSAFANTPSLADGTCTQHLVLSSAPQFNDARREAWVGAREFTTEIRDGVERLQLTDANRAYFRLQRENLRRAWEILNKEQIEGEHAASRLLLARMLGTHALFSGGPGSGKSRIARMVQAMDVEYPDGTIGPDLFSLQINQLTGDAVIRGFYDPEHAEKAQIERERLRKENADGVVTDSSTQGNSKRQITADQIFNKGTIVHFSNGFIDEIDKGNPAALAALLDILNEKIAQYGAITLKVRTESIAFTSNMTLGELISSFEAVGMRENGMALLDRIPYKIHLANKITDPEKEVDLMLLGRAARHRKIRERAKNPLDSFKSQEAQATVVTSPLPPVNLLWLGDIFEFGLDFDRMTLKILGRVKEQVELGFNDLADRSKQEASQSAQAGIKKSIFHPPTLFSSRWLAETMEASIKTSLALQLLILPEEVLPTKRLLRLLEEKTFLSFFSLWRLQDAALTASGGDPKLKFDRSSGSAIPVVTLEYGQETEKLKVRQSSARDREEIGFILEQRAIFKAAIEKSLRDNQASLQGVGELSSSLSEVLGWDINNPAAPHFQDLEEFVQHYLQTNP